MPLVIPYPKSSDKEKIPGVYAIEHKATGKKYVGGTSDLGSRGITNKSSLRLGKHKNKPLQEAYNENSEIELKVLAICETSEEAFDKEQLFIDKGMQAGELFNVSIDSRASYRGVVPSQERRNSMREKLKGRVFSPETIQRMRASQSGKKLSEQHKAKISAAVNSPEFIAKIKQANTGRKATEETRQKMSQASTGKRHSEQSKALMSKVAHTPAKPVVIKGIEYPSIKAAARSLNINPGSLSTKLSSGKDPECTYVVPK